jgi:hypothetical protein
MAVSDAPESSQSATTRGRKLVRNGAIAVGVGVLLVGGYFLINYLAFGAPSIAAKGSVEENWNSTIASLGVVPIFPPEEDLVVGDVLALIVRDDDPDPEITRTNAYLDQKSFVTRTVKLAHIDVIQELVKAYGPLPIFPASGEPPLRKAVARNFEDGVLQSNLPRAAFPKLRIQGVDSAVGGLAGAVGTATYGASNQELAEFELSDVKAYGLPSVRALEMLDAYCTAVQTKHVCLEATARKHLSRVVGDRIHRRYLAKNGDLEHAIKIEVVMVYRVYLTSAIRDLRRASRARSGFLRGLWPFGSSSDEPATRPAELVTASTAANTEQIETLKKRIADVEGQLVKLRNGGTVSFDSFHGSESSLEGKFDRPVAIAYRSVKFEFPRDAPAEDVSAREPAK